MLLGWKGGGFTGPTVIRGHILGPPGLTNPRGSWDGWMQRLPGMLWHRIMRRWYSMVMAMGLVIISYLNSIYLFTYLSGPGWIVRCCFWEGL